AASKLHIPVAHVEAGLRSFNRNMPEEINRVVTDHISDILFAPTTLAMQNLANEGIATHKCHQIGDVMLDAALFYGERSKNTSTILSQLQITDTDYVLATVHRAENTDTPFRLKTIYAALEKVSHTHPIIWPLHPRTKQLMADYNLSTHNKNMHFIEPVGYLDMVMLEQNASVIATDSGGVQKEAFFYKTPCVTLRDETEWVELVQSGWNKLTPPNNTDNISNAILNAIKTQGKPITPYGKGDAAQKIADVLLNIK
ncbi:MAG: UDP-N-acetylglucosamine 2-epimerase (non-hydrolyzing), partial [Gammaproteobacteria bacterium]|nr:UDP-N-acetylglucosamine 2-epimerase (non-hydrolyzing) [Gammaproteobacteria bacterium]